MTDDLNKGILSIPDSIPDEIDFSDIEDDGSLNEMLREMLDHMSRPLKPCTECGGLPDHDKGCFFRDKLIHVFRGPEPTAPSA